MVGGISGYNSSWQMQNMKPHEKFENADVNGDQAVDMDEFLTLGENDEKSKELFSKIDSDGDGSLTDTEMKSFGDDMRDNMQKMMSEGMGRRTGMGGPGGKGGPPPGGPGGKGGKGGPGGLEQMGGAQGSINGAQLQQMLAAYETEETDEVTEADLLESYLEALEESEDEITDSTADYFEALI